MKILVVGSGGREHALVWKMAQSGLRPAILAAPGNAGMAALARIASVAADDVEGLVRLAARERCDLAVVGPELPLALGLADALASEGLPVFGPGAAGARIEGSKWFAKTLMLEAGVPTARAEIADGPEEALSIADGMGYPVVIKADGLAAGKGVVVAGGRSEAAAAIHSAIVEGRFGSSGRRVLVEEFLAGEEASILAVTDGRRFALLPPSQDHKRALDGDKGPNTGGMGAYAPAPVIDARSSAAIAERIIAPTLAALERANGAPYRGVLYAGLMMTADGPRVIEFNCRFGDPEAQATLPLVDGDLVEILAAAAAGALDPSSVKATAGSAACVVMASGGYPGTYRKGLPISGIEEAESLDGVIVFHAGTMLVDGRLVTSGGRVLSVTAVRPDLAAAVARAYDAVTAIRFEGAHYRTDIGARALRRPPSC